VAHLLEQLRVLIEQIILTLGYPGVTLIMFAENLFPPIPSEVVLPFTGSLVEAGQLNLFGVLVASTLGAVLGTGLFYYLGRLLGERRVRQLIHRYGRWLALSEEDLDHSLKMFHRHDRSIIFFGRFLPALRTLISLPAGIAKMRLGTFLLYTTLGTLAWNSILIGAGILLGQNWERILTVVDRYETVFWIVLAGLAGLVIFQNVRKKQLRRS
jgi:membrane protein DedA with SNARE-associated domain